MPNLSRAIFTDYEKIIKDDAIGFVVFSASYNIIKNRTEMFIFQVRL